MSKVRATLQDKIRVVCQAEGTGDTVVTDVDKLYGGYGEKMGPTELVAAGLGSCILVMIGLKAQQLGLDIEGTTVAVEKEMVSDPNLRIGSLTVLVQLPIDPTDGVKQQLEAAARHCPVHVSFAANVKQTIAFEWGITT